MEAENEDYQRWRTEFYRQLESATNAMAPQFRAKALGGLTQETYDKAMIALNSARGTAADGVTPQFKHWAKNKFQLLGEGAGQALHGIVDGKPVITYERIFDVVRSCHLAVGHQGIKKTRLETVNNYSGIGLPMKAVEICVALCACAKTKLNNKKVLSAVAPGKATFLTRVQIDLIDMRSQPDGSFTWILFLRDHFSGFSWAFPLADNHGGEAARHVITVFSMFGAAKVLQTHNGKKFAAQVNHALSDTWPNLAVINKRPRNPPPPSRPPGSSSPPEQPWSGATGQLEASLRQWRETTGCTDWTRALPHCVHQLNVSPPSGSGTSSSSPYEVVFGQQPHLGHRLPQLDRPDGAPVYVDDVDSDDMIYIRGSGTAVRQAKRRQQPSPLPGQRSEPDERGSRSAGNGVSGVSETGYLATVANGHSQGIFGHEKEQATEAHQHHGQLHHLDQQQQQHQPACEFTATEELGRGNYGTVYKVQDRNVCGVAKALKMLDLPLDPYETALFRRVADTLVALFHENTVRVHRVLFLEEPFGGPHFCPPPSTTCRLPAVALVTELCEDSLAARLHRRTTVETDWSLYALRQIMQGLHFLHSHGLVHRDLRPANCLLKSDRIKLCDFGLAGLAAFNTPERLVAAVGYLAPEVSAGGPFDAGADVYSVAVVAAELYSTSEAFAPWLRDGAGRYRASMPVGHLAPAHLAGLMLHAMREAHFRPSLVTLITNI